MKRCTRCILPEVFPGIQFDDQGLCNFCRLEPTREDYIKLREKLHQRIGDLAESVRGKGQYDCIVALSGGKDSSYTLWMLREQYNLNCLAVTIDNGFLADQAVTNCRTITDALGADHIFYKPTFQFMKRMYTESLKGDIHVKASITRASAICNSCINLINNYMLKLAFLMNVPVIAGGYIGGQVPRDSAVLKMNLRTLQRGRATTQANYVERFGKAAPQYFDLPDLGDESDERCTITIINPLLTIPYIEEEVIEKIKPLGWVHPKDTGANSSNCRLNDLGILNHQRRHGFNPYVGELADLVRKGLMDREVALKKVESKLDEKDMAPLMEKLGIKSVN